MLKSLIFAMCCFPVICGQALGQVAPIRVGAADDGLQLWLQAKQAVAIGYQAVFADGSLAFKTGKAVPVSDTESTQTFRFVLSGTAADKAEITVMVRPVVRGIVTQWNIRYFGEAKDFNVWATGFWIKPAEVVERAMTKSTIRWVKPTGRHEWEVPGDMPYPDFEAQIRQVKLRGLPPIAFVTPWYDPDWLYGNDLRRASFLRASLPKESPLTLGIFNADGAEPEDLSALVQGHPLSLKLQTKRIGNLFEPKETITLSVRVGNVTEKPVKCKVTYTVHDYYGTLVARGEKSLDLRPSQMRSLPLRFAYGKRGILFVIVRLRSGEWEREQWTTIGVLPQRRLTPPNPESPFGLAAIIANPSIYPDQPDLETVLRMVQRIGVRWVRYCPFPVKTTFTPEEERKVRETVALFQRYGISLHPQIGISITEQPNWQEALEATLKKFGWVSDYIELGNELNPLGASADEQRRSARDYVEHILKPFHALMRKVHPKGKVMTHGLAGVWQDYLDGLEQAGGTALFDVLSIHPGFHPRAPEFYEGWKGWVFRTQMEDAMAFARKHGKEVWITEVYAPTPPARSAVDLRTSADYLVRTYVLSLLYGVRVVEWYQFQDGVWHSQIPNPTDVEYNFGIVYTDLSPKPAYIAYGVMTEQLEGSRCIGRLDLGADDLYGVRFEKDGQFVDVLWSYRERHETDMAWWPPERFKDKSRRPGMPWENRWRQPVSVRLPAQGHVTVTDIMGNTKTLKPRNGFVTLQLSGSPIFVRGLAELPVTR